MERGTRFLIFITIFGGLYLFFNKKDDTVDVQPIVRKELIVAKNTPSTSKTCDLWTEEYHAVVASRGAVIEKLEPLTAKYRKDGEPTELVTTGSSTEFSPLFTDFRTPAKADDGKDWLVRQEIQNYEIVKSSPTECELRFRDDRVEILKKYRALEAPYGIEMTTSV
ncbi:MAG: hypothetical protein MK135_06600, partial [Polyangiaceae bacterium]|nr:hypothetical protein [Polyangiaceae bacterium]